MEIFVDSFVLCIIGEPVEWVGLPGFAVNCRCTNTLTAAVTRLEWRRTAVRKLRWSYGVFNHVGMWERIPTGSLGWGFVRTNMDSRIDGSWGRRSLVSSRQRVFRCAQKRFTVWCFLCCIRRQHEFQIICNKFLYNEH